MLDTLETKKRKRETLIKPQSNGILERAIVVGGGLCTMYTFAATLPIASIAACAAMGAYFWHEINNFQLPEKAEELKLILEAKTPVHPSIKDIERELKKRFPVHAINEAIESMLGQTEWIVFRADDPHPLAKFECVYCWVNPLDPKKVMLPLQRLEDLLRLWGYLKDDNTPELQVQAPAPTPQEVIPEIQPIEPSFSQKDLLMAGAIATAVQNQSSPPSTPSPAVRQYQSLIEVITCNPKSLFLSAPARCGKGVTIAAAIRAVQKNVPNIGLQSVRYWAMSIKQDPREWWYWESCDRFFNPDCENRSPAIAAQEIYQFLREFQGLQRDRLNPTILVMDEFSRTVSLLSSVKMFQVDPENYPDDKTPFVNWLIDRVVHSASMAQSQGFWVWVITPANAVSGKGYTKGDIGSLNIYTLAARDNHKFADGGSAAFSAPEIDGTHPVFQRGYLAGYSHQSGEWYHVPDYAELANRRTDIDAPVVLTNRWVPGAKTEMSLPVDPLLESPTVAETPAKDDGWLTQVEKVKEMIDTLRPTFHDGELTHLEDEYLELMEQLKDLELLEQKRIDLVHIVLWSLKKGEINAQAISERFHREQWLQSINKSRKAIRALFRELAEMGIGDCYGEGDRTSYKALAGDERNL